MLCRTFIHLESLSIHSPPPSPHVSSINTFNIPGQLRTRKHFPENKTQGKLTPTKGRRQRHRRWEDVDLWEFWWTHNSLWHFWRRRQDLEWRISPKTTGGNAQSEHRDHGTYATMMNKTITNFWLCRAKILGCFSEIETACALSPEYPHDSCVCQFVHVSAACGKSNSWRYDTIQPLIAGFSVTPIICNGISMTLWSSSFCCAFFGRRMR